jgi:two-component system sensor histidine kinase/response regulator
MDTMKKTDTQNPELTDISDLNLQLQMLKTALTQAQEANRAKSTFLSNMSHDIRTPMNAIAGMAAIALSHIDEKARVQDCLQKIQTASSHLMSLVNDVLDISRIDSDRMSLNEETFSLADLVHDITVIVRPQAVQKEHDLKIEIGQIYQEVLIGDPLRLRQILVNIIGNAIKYTPDNGEILVRLFQHRADDTADSRNQNRIFLDFTCEDNGIGMSSEFLERIFVPFERVKNAAVNKIEGTGLGMSIVKSLIDRMDGQIKVESTEGVGSSFQIRLPLSFTSQDGKNLERLTGKAVLIAESQEQQAARLIAFLQEADMIPLHVKSGLGAVTCLTQANSEHHMPCALLLGQELEDMSPLELAAHIRQSAGPDFPILLVSDVDWAQLEYRATRVGVSAFVPCPLFKSRLLSTLSDLTDTDSSHQDFSVRASTDYSGCHVLLVEDNELNQEIALEMLSLNGVDAEVADNGAHALEKFEASPEYYFDLIFMDVQMPVMNGYEATRRLRKLSRKDAEKVWVVAMTANAFVEDIRAAKDAGMNEHLSKPVSMEQLQDVLYRQLKKREKD